MADGRVEIKFLTDIADIDRAKKAVAQLGTDVEKSLTINNSNASQAFDTTANSASQAVEEISKIKPQTDNASAGLKNIGDTSQSSVGGVKNLVGALGLFKIATVAINAITDSIDTAVARVDTMNAFPRMMEAVGFEAEASQASIQKLSEGIQGLPTRLDEVVSTTQQLALTTGDLEEATELTLALNNAFLASGSNSADASRGLQQFSQMLSAGKVDMQSWRTLLETMPLALTKVAEGFGFAGDSAKNDLYSALQEGTITFDEFSGKLIELNEGIGGFAELALINSEGIATSFANIRTAVATGVANTIQALDDLLVELTGKNIAQHFDSLKNVVRTAFNTISSGIRGSLPYVQSAISVFQRMLPVIVGLGSAFTAFRILTSVSQWFSNLNAVLNVVRSTKTAYLGISQALLVTETSATTVQRVLATAYGILTGQISLATIATTAFSTAMSFLSGPIGLVVTAVGVLAGGVLALYQIMGDSSEEVLSLTADMDEAVENSSKMTENIQGNIEKFQDNIQEIETNRQSLKDLADQLDDLVGKEEKTVADKEKIKAIVDELNRSVQGLNLQYDAETDSLNKSSEAMNSKIDAMSNYALKSLALERSIEIVRELNEIEIQLETNRRRIAESQQQVDDNFWNFGGGNRGLLDGIEELEAQQESLRESYQSLQMESVVVNELLQEHAEATMQAVVTSNEKQIVSFQDLSEEQRAVIDQLTTAYEEYRGIAQNMFEAIDDTSETTVSAMIENLQHNQEALATYAENMKAIEEAVATLDPSGEFLTTLQNLGPSAAGEVQNIASSIGSDNFATLVETFTGGGEEAKDALLTALGMEDTELPEGMDTLIENSKTSLLEQVEASGLDEIGKIMLEEVAIGITENEEEMKSGFTQIIDKIPEWIDPDTDIIKEKSKEIPQAIGEGVTENEEVMQVEIEKAVESSVVESITNQSENSSSQGSQIVDDISSGVTENQETLQEAIEEAISIPEGKDEELGDESVSMGKSIIDGAKMGVDENKSTFADALKLAGEEALSSFKTASGVASPSTLYSQASADIVAGAVNGIVSNQGTLVSAVSTMANLALSAFVQAQPRAYSAGRNLGLGLNSGLESTRSSIMATASSIASSAVNAINTALEVASPSRKGKYSGRMLGQGLVVGMEDEISNVQLMADRLGTSAIPKIDRVDISSYLDLPKTTYRTVVEGKANQMAQSDEETKELLREIANKTPILVAEDDTILARYRPRMDKENGIIAKNVRDWRLN